MIVLHTCQACMPLFLRCHWSCVLIPWKALSFCPSWMPPAGNAHLGSGPQVYFALLVKLFNISRSPTSYHYFLGSPFELSALPFYLNRGPWEVALTFPDRPNPISLSLKKPSGSSIRILCRYLYCLLGSTGWVLEFRKWSCGLHCSCFKFSPMFGQLHMACYFPFQLKQHLST